MIPDADYTYEDGLVSERLVTRKLEFSDFQPWIAFVSDPDCMAYFPDQGATPKEQVAQNWIRWQLKRYEDRRYGLQALLHRETGEFIGQCGLMAQEVNGTAELEVGYHILKKYWGQGYAPEAARLFLDYGFRKYPVDSIVSIIHVDNIKSQRVAEKNHLEPSEKTTWQDLPILLYRIHRSRWENLPFKGS